MTKENHILVLPPDEAEGKTYVIGDVHGSLGAFQAVLDKLNVNDRLIILGDLVDRGESDQNNPTSANILEIFINHNQAPIGTKPKLYALAGNHEKNFLQILDIFDCLKNGEFVSEERLFSVILFIRNGGAWIFKHDSNDFVQSQRLLWFRAFSLKDNSPACKLNFHGLLKQIINSKDPYEHLIPEINKYRSLIKSLPFAIQLEGEHPALCVHSDLNISDAEFDHKVLHQQGFDENEINYLTDARVKDFNSQDKRNSSSRLVMVGHNIIDEEYNTVAHPALPVRAETNHINLDCGAYFTNSFLLLNVTDNRIEIVSKDVPVACKGFLEYAQKKIQEYLDQSELKNEQQASKRPRLL